MALVSAADAEALIHTLRGLGYAVGAIVEQEAVGRLATVRLGRTAGARAPVIGLLFASSGIEPEIVAAAEIVEVLPGLQLPVARTGHLVAVKVLSRDDVQRPQDLVDLRALLRLAPEEERQRAREALALIAARGYDRGRNLPADLQQLIKSSR